MDKRKDTGYEQAWLNYTEIRKDNAAGIRLIYADVTDALMENSVNSGLCGRWFARTLFGGMRSL